MPFELALNSTHYFLSIALALAAACVTPFDKLNVSGAFYLIAMIFVYIPLTATYGLDAARPITPVLATLIAISVSLVASRVTEPLIALSVISNGKRIAITLSLMAVGMFIGWSIYSGAARQLNFDMSSVYEYRRDAGAILDTGLMAYTNSWAQKVFNPFLFCIALYHRKWSFVAGTLFIQLFFFAVTSHRSHLFLPVLCVLMWGLYSRDISLTRVIVSVGFVFAAALLIVVQFEADQFGAIVIRRALFVPSSATFSWFAYFSEYEKIVWTDRILSGIAESKYTGVRIPYLLGDYYAPNKDVSFNNGLVSSGYSHAGFVGVVVYSVIIGYILGVANYLVRRGVPVWIAVAILAGPFRTAWADSDLFASLLTHGILIAIVLIWIHGKADGQLRGNNTANLAGVK
jgi:hypothetical protein